MINLFVTGMLRSGTTLLEKALNAHPNVSLFYQPFTEFFLNTKRTFLKAKGILSEYHVLSHYCREHRYTPADFTAWLEQTYLSQSFVKDSLPQEKHDLVDSSYTDNSHFSKWYAYLLGKMQFPGDYQCSGSKEVLMEEYVPYLVNHGVRCIIIVRDPRDVIVSLDYGLGKAFTGNHRPTLFNLRNWRKSVAFAQQMVKNPCFKFIRFEDLILQPSITLSKVASWLNLKPIHEEWWEDLRDENCLPWKGNSSFGAKKPFNAESIGRHDQILSDTTRLYIESICMSEMTSIGYLITPLTVKERIDCITSFKETFEIRRPEFSHNYSSLQDNISYEIERLTSNCILSATRRQL